MRVLFLDDHPRRTDAFRQVFPDTTWVRTVEECIERLSEEWDVIQLDHDLGGEILVDSSRKDCGTEVVRHIVRDQPQHLRSALFKVHTYNEDAAQSMVEELNAAGYKCEYQPLLQDLQGLCRHNERARRSQLDDIAFGRVVATDYCYV